MNKSLKEIKVKTIKNLEEVSKSLGEKKPNRWKKQNCSRPENENINNKENTKWGILEIKNLGKQTGATDTSTTSRIQKIDKRIS